MQHLCAESVGRYISVIFICSCSFFRDVIMLPTHLFLLGWGNSKWNTAEHARLEAAKIYMVKNVWSCLMNNNTNTQCYKTLYKGCLSSHPSIILQKEKGRWVERQEVPLAPLSSSMRLSSFLALSKDVIPTPWAEHPPQPAHVAPVPSCETALRLCSALHQDACTHTCGPATLWADWPSHPVMPG